MVSLKNKKSSSKAEQNKKVIRMNRFDEMNMFIKTDADVTGASESSIIEDAISKKYLNNTEEAMADAVLYNITKEDAVTAMCSSVFSYFAAMPSYATSESIRPLLNQCIRMAVRTPLEIKKDNYLYHFQQQLELVYGFFKDCYDRNVVCIESKGYSKVTKDVLDFFEMVIKDINFINNGQTDSVMWSSEMGTILSTLNNYLDFGNQKGMTFCNWSFTYRLLHDVAELSNWQNDSENRYQVSKLIKEIRYSSEESSAFDPKICTLDNYIFLKGGKVIRTTKDAVILRIDPNKKNEDYLEARRVIHGIGGSGTKVPYIILYNETDKNELEEKIHELVVPYFEEFSNPLDSYPAQILFNCHYYDSRIIYDTI